MELRKKDTILEESIKESDEFKNKYDFIKGYFSDLISVNDNNEFLELYRYVQYWKLDIPQILIDYASTRNYCKESLIANMLLTGDDEYYKKFVELISKSQFLTSSTKVFPPVIGNKPFLDLAKANRPDLTHKIIEEGNTPHDIFSSSYEGNSTLQIVKELIDEGYIPSDEIIIWYISKGMGGLAKECIIEDYSDIEFIFEEDPIDLDFFNYMISQGYEINPDIAERMLYRQFDSKMEIDVVLFMILYRLAKPILTLQSKLSILHHVLDKNESLLTRELLKDLDNDGIDRDRVETIILYTAKSINGYVIFSLDIVGEKNYDKIFDFCCDIDTEEKTNYYKITTQDEEDLANGKYCETTSSSDEHSDNENSDFIESRENSEIPDRYRFNSADNEPEEITYDDSDSDDEN